MAGVKKFFALSIDPDSGYTSFDDIIERAMDDPKLSKIYPMITNNHLLEELIRFIESPPKKIKGVGIANGIVFKKENGRQVSGSHRYLGVLEEDGTNNLYKKFKGGPLDGETWLILRIQDESCRTTKFILEFTKTMGTMPRIRDVEDHFSCNKVLISRDRIQIILNHCHEAVNVVHKKTCIDYDVSTLSLTSTQQENLFSNDTINTIATQKPRQIQSSINVTSLDNIDGKESSKRLAKPIVCNALPLEPQQKQQPDTVKSETPLTGRLRKRKTAASSIMNIEDNPKSAPSDNSGRAGSSITSKRRRRE